MLELKQPFSIARDAGCAVQLALPVVFCGKSKVNANCGLNSWIGVALGTLSQLRSAVRVLLERKDLVALRFLFDLMSHLNSHKVVSRAENEFGWRSFRVTQIRELKSRKSSQTLFIIGSGSSVNKISKDRWVEIAKDVSIGINHWTLHKFVPDIYSIETIPDWRKGQGTSRTSLEIDQVNHLRLLERPEVLNSEATILALAPRTEWENSQLLEIPRSLWSKTFVYYRSTPFTRDLSNLRGDFHRGLKISESGFKKLVVPDSGASLARMVSLGILAGFERIVLLGVDLSTKYFWQEPGSQIIAPELHYFEQPMRGGVHETMSKLHRPFSILEVLDVLRRIGLERGVRLFSEGNYANLPLPRIAEQ